MNWLIIQALDTPLIYACRTGRSGIIAMLINNGANPNATNRVRITELLVFTIILLHRHPSDHSAVWVDSTNVCYRKWFCRSSKKFTEWWSPNLSGRTG